MENKSIILHKSPFCARWKMTLSNGGEECVVNLLVHDSFSLQREYLISVRNMK